MIERISTIASVSSNYVFRRMAATFVPGAEELAPRYASRICHSQVAQAVLKRGIESDKIWLFGTSHGDVMHSVLTDKSDRVLIDAFAHPGAKQFLGTRGYSKVINQEGETLDYVAVKEVGELYSEYGSGTTRGR